MGVLGLWNILESVGHPIKLDALEGKRLGVDANLWLYKFIRGFRERDGMTNLESHKLGLFNRISKLLFYKIKPVFVFDGPAPVLKRRTLQRRQDVRNKHLTKMQESAMRALAEQIKKQYPNANLDEITIKLPEFRSNGLAAAEKLTDEDLDLFYMPPEVRNREEEDKSDDATDPEPDPESDPVFVRAHFKHDINSDDFDALPPEIRYEILQDVKVSRKAKNPTSFPCDADSFSKVQLNRLMARRSVQSEIERCEKEICASYFGEAFDFSQPLPDITKQSATKTEDHQSPYSGPSTKPIGTMSSTQPAAFGLSSERLADSRHGLARDEENLNVRRQPQSLSTRTEDHQSPDSGPMTKLIGTMHDKASRTARDSERRLNISTGRPEVVDVESIEPSVGVALGSIGLETTTSSADDRDHDNSTLGPRAHPVDANSVTNFTQQAATYELSSESLADSRHGLAQDDENLNVRRQPEDHQSPDPDSGPSTQPMSTMHDKASRIARDTEKRLTNKVTDKIIDEANELSCLFDVPHIDAAASSISKHQQSLSGGASRQLQQQRYTQAAKSTGRPEVVDVESIEPSVGVALGSIGLETTTSSADDRDHDNSTLGPRAHPVAANSVTNFTQPAAFGLSSERLADSRHGLARDEENLNVRRQPEDHQSPDPDSGPSTQPMSTMHDKASRIARDTEKRLTNKVTDKIIEEAKELLCLFGVPYIDAAGEAEAQCALLEELQLTEGTITDDSDIWLFGAKNVYRHFFSDDKYVMQYKMSDIEFHVRLTRDNLVCFAMLVGSDYTDGIMNVGPVTALELLSEFPGQDLEPLVKFKRWHREITQSKEKIKVGSKKLRTFLKFRLPDEFPSKAVFEGYMRPVADSSTEAFSWGTPDLDELREYARRNFDWDMRKIDEKLLPVMKKLSEGRIQKTIDSYFFKTAANQNPELFRSKRVNQALTKMADRKKAAVEIEVINLSEDDETEEEGAGSGVVHQRKKQKTPPKKSAKGKQTQAHRKGIKQEKVAKKEDRGSGGTAQRTRKRRKS